MHLDSTTTRKLTRDVARASGGIRQIALIFAGDTTAIPISMTLQVRVEGRRHFRIRSSYVQTSRDDARIGYEFSMPAGVVVPASVIIAFAVPPRLRIVRVSAGVMRAGGFTSVQLTHGVCPCGRAECSSARAVVPPRMCRDIARESTMAMGGLGPDTRVHT